MGTTQAINPEFFREYDVRGFVGRDLNPDFIYGLGRAIATLAHERGAKVMTAGRDCRLSSERYQATIMLGLSNGGISVIDIGLCVTPSQAGM